MVEINRELGRTSRETKGIVVREDKRSNDKVRKRRRRFRKGRGVVRRRNSLVLSVETKNEMFLVGFVLFYRNQTF